MDEIERLRAENKRLLAASVALTECIIILDEVQLDDDVPRAIRRRAMFILDTARAALK